MKRGPAATSKPAARAPERRPWVVLKFGGTSVANLKCWRTIADVLRQRLAAGERPIVVCSAAAGVSDEIERLLAEAQAGSHRPIIESLARRHEELARELGVGAEIARPHLDELERLATGVSLTREATPRITAQAMALGEIMLTQLGAAFLNADGVTSVWRDARDHLTALPSPHATERQTFLSAACGCEPDGALAGRLASDAAAAVITQGFIARDAEGETVLLGRGGSDVSAACFAAKLSAARCEIWSDVPGLYTADPRRVTSARIILSLDYDEAQEIASSGAKVLHPRCIAPLKVRRIPIHLRSIEHPEMAGTVISDDAPAGSAQVKAISSRAGVTLISMETLDMWHQAGFLAQAFGCFARHGVSIDLVSTSETNVTVTLDEEPLSPAAIEALVGDLKAFCEARAIPSCAAVSLVGRNIRAILHRLAPALEVFEEQRVYLLSQAAGDLNLTFVVDEDQAARLVGELHSRLFRQERGDPQLGPTWQDLSEGTGRRGTPKAWWRQRRDDLIALALKKTPIYAYDRATVSERIGQLKALSSVGRILYSLKANSNPEILKLCRDAGLGFECVSPGEIAHVMKNFPVIEPGRILFTPNFAGRDEYERAFGLGAMVTLDNVYPIEAWPKAFDGRDIFVRVDPGEGKGHHKYVHTAGAKSKFGVWPSELTRLSELAAGCSARIVGLHAHVGSNIFEPEAWAKTALFLAEIARGFPSVRALDLGGGLGVVERPGGAPLNLKALDEGLGAMRRDHPDLELWIEPGRFVIAEAGVLLARVTQTKRKGDYLYVGVDTGMNTLIRPALYGAHHEIVNLTRLDEEADAIASIVGPICESGDILGHERRIPSSTRDGDVILIATAGAYGRAMSSSYNMRDPAGEAFL